MWCRLSLVMYLCIDFILMKLAMPSAPEGICVTYN